jgi:Rrf2 family protein
LFSATFRYALIGLLEIASAEQGVKVGEIAERHGISGRYLANVLSQLRRMGLITSQQGRHGGYQLAKAAAEISLLGVHQGLAGSADTDEEQDPQRTSAQKPAGADTWLQAIEQRWRLELANTSLQDVKEFLNWGPDVAPAGKRQQG